MRVTLRGSGSRSARRSFRAEALSRDRLIIYVRIRGIGDSSSSGALRRLITCQISVSLDWFVAGTDQSLDDPIGTGGLRLHEWIVGTAAWARMQGRQPTVPETPDSEVLEHAFDNVGAYIMGRHMFTAGRGEWDLTWRGWWGDDRRITRRSMS